METASTTIHPARTPWNKGKLVGQKAPFKLKEIWAIRIQLQLARNRRELALFNLAVDSKLRACDLVKLRVADVCHGLEVGRRATIMQQKTQRPVQFEITDPTREAISAWMAQAELRPAISCSRVGLHDSLTSQPGNTLGLSTAGWRGSGWTALLTALIPCGEPRRP